MVSIIIPTYNRGNTIERCINSLLKQTYSDFEIIIVDDNSKDDTENIIKGIYDSRIRYIKHNKNLGANEARNTGIINSTGEFIAFQDSDDEWVSNKLEIQLKSLSESKADIVASSFTKYMDNSKKVLPKEYIDDNNIHIKVLQKNFFSTQTILGKSECFKENLFDKNLPRFQDWELMIRLTQKYKVHFINYPLVNVYIQNDSITKKPEKAIKAIKLIMEKHYNLIRSNNKSLAEFNILLGNIKNEMKDFTKCYYWQALKYDKLNYKTYARICIYYIQKLSFYCNNYL